MYRWDPKYPLGKGPLDRIKGSTILQRMREYARDHHMFDNARFQTEVETVKENEDGCGCFLATTMHPGCTTKL